MAHTGLKGPKNGDHVLAMTPEIGRRKSIVYWAGSARQNDIFQNSVKRPHLGLKGLENDDCILVMTPKIGRRKSVVCWASSA